MVKVDFQLMPREPKGQQVWIIVAGVVVEKCAIEVKAERLAAHGYKAVRRGGYQSGAVKR